MIVEEILRMMTLIGRQSHASSWLLTAEIRWLQNLTNFNFSSFVVCLESQILFLVSKECRELSNIQLSDSLWKESG